MQSVPQNPAPKPNNTAASRQPEATPVRSRIRAALMTTLQIAIIVPAALFIKSNTIELFKIPTGSMEPTLHGANDLGNGFGDHLFVGRYPYGLSGVMKVPLANWRFKMPYDRIMLPGMHLPRVGDVVVFENPADTRIDYIKRCAGTPGDRLFISNGHLYVNGTIVTNSPATASYVEYVNVGLLSDNSGEVRTWVEETAELELGLAIMTNAALAKEVLDLLGPYRPGITADKASAWLRQRKPQSEQSLLPGPVSAQLGALIRREKLDGIMDAVLVNGVPFRGCSRSAMAGRVMAEVVVPSNCFFMLGDNSRNSQDSRYWGFVPFELIKGKALCVYLPLKRIRAVR